MALNASLADRLANALKAQASDVVGRLEDPQKLLALYQRHVDSQIRAKKAELRQATAAQIGIEKELKRANGSVAESKAAAVRMLECTDDGATQSAKEFAEQAVDASDLAEGLLGRLGNQQSIVAGLQTAIVTLERKRKEAGVTFRILKSRAAVAKGSQLAVLEYSPYTDLLADWAGEIESTENLIEADARITASPPIAERASQMNRSARADELLKALRVSASPA